MMVLSMKKVLFCLLVVSALCSAFCSVTAVADDETYYLGDVLRCSQFKGYAGTEEITKDDPHYNKTVGSFYVSGFSGRVKDSDGNMIFLKEQGDKVSLMFKLQTDIDAVGGNKKLSVTEDKKAYDQYFQTATQDFGRGAVIIRSTDYKNIRSDPQIYTNYLSAKASRNADTTVKLCEEGDYEVALDYQLTEDKLINKDYHYRIFFRFSVRNANCMVFPFELETQNELMNTSMTERGFTLDLAQSKYLKVTIKREVMTEGRDGLIEDVRFNGMAKEGREYVDEGIYTITAKNLYTEEQTVKKIYVGEDPVLRAYVTTDLSISEINDLMLQGAKIRKDGTIVKPRTSSQVNNDSPTSNNPNTGNIGDIGQSYYSPVIITLPDLSGVLPETIDLPDSLSFLPDSIDVPDALINPPQSIILPNLLNYLPPAVAEAYLSYRPMFIGVFSAVIVLLISARIRNRRKRRKHKTERKTHGSKESCE